MNVRDDTTTAPATAVADDAPLAVSRRLRLITGRTPGALLLTSSA